MAPEAGRGAPRASDGSTLAVVPPIQTTVFVRLQVRSAPGPKRVPKDGTPVWVRCSLPAPVGCAPRVRAAMTLAPGKACKQAVHARHGRGLKLRQCPCRCLIVAATRCRFVVRTASGSAPVVGLERYGGNGPF